MPQARTCGLEYLFQVSEDLFGLRPHPSGNELSGLRNDTYLAARVERASTKDGLRVRTNRSWSLGRVNDASCHFAPVLPFRRVEAIRFCCR